MASIKLLELHEKQKFAAFQLPGVEHSVLVGILDDGRLSVSYAGDVKIVSFDKPKTQGKTVKVKCAICGNTFDARVADRKRGWAKCCSKSCAATYNNRRTGNYARYCRLVELAERYDYDYEDCGGFDNCSCQNED